MPEARMSDATVTCPHCRSPFALTESLAAPLIAATKRHYDSLLSKKEAEFLARQQSLHATELRLAESQRALEATIAERVAHKSAEERMRIAAEERNKAKLAAASDLAAKTRELTDLHEILKVKDEKLAEAQKTQVDLLKKQRQLDDALRESDLRVEQRVQQALGEARMQAKREAEEALKLKVAERDHQIISMQQTIEELKRKAEQGSQQMQGEVQELDLEASLRAEFRMDAIDPVPKGEFGGDVLQGVVSASGQHCGTILWESKRTKNWSDAWLAKLRDDQRAAKADICVLVTQVMPKGVDTFCLIDGVWVTTPKTAIAVGMLLRHTIVQLAAARCASIGQQTKTEMVYAYLTGPRFKQRVEAMVESFVAMREDLEREQRATERAWAKREAQIERMMKATAGMYGDLQGIAGKSLAEIEGMAFDAGDDRPRSLSAPAMA